MKQSEYEKWLGTKPLKAPRLVQLRDASGKMITVDRARYGEAQAKERRKKRGGAAGK